MNPNTQQPLFMSPNIPQPMEPMKQPKPKKKLFIIVGVLLLIMVSGYLLFKEYSHV
jgi:LPS O-antigen subunit length determinant protein (WzzB/FepE family)